MAASSANQEDINMRKGPWEEDEDELLKAIVLKMGEGRWDSLAKASGLLRSGKSCRLRWLNYLRPNLKHDKLSEEEETVVIQLQQQWGNKWSKIAKTLPGRTDNELKNYWRTRVRQQQSQTRKLEMYMNMSMSCEHQEISSNDAGTTSESTLVSINDHHHGINQEFSIEEKMISDDQICAAQMTTAGTTHDPFGLEVGLSSDFGIAYSPAYEPRLSHWNMSDYQIDQQANLGTDHHQESLEDVSQQECFYSLWDS
ncbi:unnamed protein product [Rhodiola kirilowii]